MRFVKNETIKKLLVELLELTIDFADSAAQTASPLIKPGRYLINPFYDEMCAENKRLYLDYLRKRKLIKRQSGPSEQKVIYCMTTDAVCLATLEKIRRIVKQPLRWDGKLRAIAFDIPENKKTVRSFLREYLHELGFYCLQKSFWICPYDIIKYLEIFIITAKLDKWVTVFEVKHLFPNHKKILKRFNLDDFDQSI